MSRHKQTWDLLEEALASLDYRREPPPPSPLRPDQPGRRFQLVRDDESNFAQLFIFTYNPNTYKPNEMRHTRHEFIVPVCTYHRRQWQRWVVERILSIEAHETLENIFVDGERIHSPYHGNGWDPYAVWFEGDPVERAKAPGEE